MKFAALFAGSAPDGKRRAAGWIPGGLLLGLYLLLKAQGWGYAHQARQLSAQLEGLRPTLSVLAMGEQLEKTLQSCRNVSEEIRAMGVDGGRLLGLLSRVLPPSATLEWVEVRAGRHLELKIRGTLRPGVRDPEAALLPWAERLRSIGRVRVERLFPEAQLTGVWGFVILVEGR